MRYLDLSVSTTAGQWNLLNLQCDMICFTFLKTHLDDYTDNWILQEQQLKQGWGGWEVQGEGMYVYKQLIHLAAETDNTVKHLYSN